MPKLFSEKEKEIIRNKLIDEYRNSLLTSSDISVEELTSKVGISKGYFYSFYDYKELLFVDVVNQITSELNVAITSIVNSSEKNKKEKLKEIFSYLYVFIKRNPWIKKVSGIEYERILSKLPKETQDSLDIDDKQEISRILMALKIQLKVPEKEAIGMIQLVLFTVPYNDVFKNDYLKSYNALVNAVIENIVEG